MSNQTEVTGVRAAVEHLVELADRMRDKTFGFNENDVSNLDKVIEAIHELDKERSKLHDVLETETIKSSVIRHRLQFLPAEIEKEVIDAVNSARQSNVVVLQNMQKQLEDINGNTKFLEERQKTLNEENAVLHPQRDIIKQQHEEIISQLNQRMAEKASMQITLNETRDKVRQTNQEIVEIEDSILQLKDDLIAERHTARTEKKELQQSVKETTEKTKEQREENMVKKKELDALHEKLIDSEGQLDGVRRSLRRYEASRDKLDKQAQQLETQLTEQRRKNEELRRKGAAIVSEDLKRQKEFEEEEANLKTKLKRLENEIQREKVKQEEVEAKKLELHVEYEDRIKIKNSDAERIEALNARLQGEKRNLAMKAEEVGMMHAENADMQEKIVSLEESHVAVLAQMNKQIEEYRDQLSRERKDRIEVQSRRESVQSEIEEYTEESEKQVIDLEEKIQNGKIKQVELSKETKDLQEELKVETVEIESLEQEVSVAQKKYEKMFHMKQDEVETQQTEIKEMEQRLSQMRLKMEDELPKFQELEKYFETRKDSYDKMRKEIVAMKSKKLVLEDSVTKTKREREKIRQPQEQLKKELKLNRASVIGQMKNHGEEMQSIEKQIYGSVCKLRTVEEENKKLELGCEKLQKSIDDLHKDMEENVSAQERLTKELAEIRDDLLNGWIENQDMQKNYAERDKEVIAALGQLLNKTENRELIVADITSKLEGELYMLAGFLENLASRRPKVRSIQRRKSQSRLEGRDTLIVSQRKNKPKK